MVSFFFSKFQGRNNTGHLTVKHRGGGQRMKFVNTPSNYSFIGNSLTSKDYILFSAKLSMGSSQVRISPDFSASGYNLYFLPRNISNQQGFESRPIFSYSIGQFVSHVEFKRGFGPKICRAFGSYAQILKKRGTYATLRLPSGEIRRISVFCHARMMSVDHNQFSRSLSKKKAGTSRLLGIRPHVRGCAINPVDHPHGGRTGDSRPSVSPWGQLTKGYRTRFKKINRKFVIFSVQDIKNRKHNNLYSL